MSPFWIYNSIPYHIYLSSAVLIEIFNQKKWEIAYSFDISQIITNAMNEQIQMVFQSRICCFWSAKLCYEAKEAKFF